MKGAACAVHRRRTLRCTILRLWRLLLHAWMTRPLCCAALRCAVRGGESSTLTTFGRLPMHARCPLLHRMSVLSGAILSCWLAAAVTSWCTCLGALSVYACMHACVHRCRPPKASVPSTPTLPCRSWRAQFARLRGVRAPSAPSPLPIKGQALCYNTQTGRVLAFSARQRMLSALLPNGSVCSAVSELAGGGTAHRPLLASTDSKLVVLAAADGPLEVRRCGMSVCCVVCCVLHHVLCCMLCAPGNDKQPALQGICRCLKNTVDYTFDTQQHTAVHRSAKQYTAVVVAAAAALHPSSSSCYALTDRPAPLSPSTPALLRSGPPLPSSQLWDAESLEPLGQLTGHMSFVTSLAASGPLVASTCAAELRLWNAASRICLLQVPVGLPLPSPGVCVYIPYAPSVPILLPGSTAPIFPCLSVCQPVCQSVPSPSPAAPALHSAGAACRTVSV